MEYIGAVTRRAALDRDEWLKFLRETKDGQFLFDDDIGIFLKELEEKGNDLAAVSKMIETKSMGDELNRLVDNQSELVGWFMKQFERSKNLFGTYLEMRER